MLDRQNSLLLGPSIYRVDSLGGWGVWQNSTLIHEGDGGARIHVDTRFPKSAKNILKYLYFHEICPREQSGGGGGGELRKIVHVVYGWPLWSIFFL